MVVDTPADFPGKSIGSIPRIVLKPTEGARGQPLVGAAAKVADGFFWIALSAADADIASNLSLMRERNWIDLPFVYENGQRAILTFEKGPDGEAAFQQAFNAWARAQASDSPGGAGDFWRPAVRASRSRDARPAHSRPMPETACPRAHVPAMIPPVPRGCSFAS